MKTYVNGQQMRLVGKAWEIRHFLKSVLERNAVDLPLADFLGGGRKGARLTPAPSAFIKQRYSR